MDQPPRVLGRLHRNAADGVSVDTRYKGYIDIHTNLDRLAWATQATLLGITVLACTTIGYVLHRRISLADLTPSQTAGAACLMIALLYVWTVFSLRRLAKWHSVVEHELGQLEPSGYFQRRRLRSKAISARGLTIWLFGAFAVAFAILSFILFFEEQEVPMPKEGISPERAAAEFGISTHHEEMENGERRFRLLSRDGNAYIRTEAARSEWQRSHFHNHTRETYVVERGWMLLLVAGEAGAKPVGQRVQEQGVITTPVGRTHNVYLPAGAVIHTIKHGSTGATGDWHPAPELDAIIAAEGDQILARAIAAAAH